MQPFALRVLFHRGMDSVWLDEIGVLKSNRYLRLFLK